MLNQTIYRQCINANLDEAVDMQHQDLSTRDYELIHTGNGMGPAANHRPST